jgi:phosphoribosylanthranilate isomerase
MLIPKVKICGITNDEDAKAAVDMGADILGFNFYPESPRFITPQKAAQIISKLSAFIDVAGIFVNDSFNKVADTVDYCRLDWIQLHGDEQPEDCRSFFSLNVKTMKAIRVEDNSDVKRADDFPTDAILFDAFHPDKYGGTGLSFDWSIVGHVTRRIFLAGGINPDNAVTAIGLGVYGIDVCSGIEAQPGKKDHEKMRQLFENIKHLRG